MIADVGCRSQKGQHRMSATLSQIAAPRRKGSLAICIGPAPRYRRSGRPSTTVPKSIGCFPRPPELAPYIGATGQDRSPSPLGAPDAD